MKKSYLFFPVVFTIILFFIFANSSYLSGDKDREPVIKNTRTFSKDAIICYVDTSLGKCKSGSCPTIEDCINNNKKASSLDVKILVEEYTSCPNIVIDKDMQLKISSNNANYTTEVQCESGFIIKAQNSELKLFIENINFEGSESTCLSLTSNKKSFLTMDNVQIHNCESLGDGGAVLALGFEVYVKDSTFSKNFARNSTMNPGSGGAIWSNHLVSVSRSSFEDNKADLNGGAICAGSVKIMDCEFKGSEAVNGGAISTSKATIQQTIFSNNVAQENGGALELNSEHQYSYLYKNEFDSNQAYFGGHLYLLPSNISVLACDFEHGQAEFGGAIYIQDKYYDKPEYQYELVDSVFNSNKATAKGGAFYSLHTKNLIGGVFTDSQSSDSQIQSFPDFYINHVNTVQVPYAKNCSRVPAVKDHSFETFLCIGVDSTVCKNSQKCNPQSIKLLQVNVDDYISNNKYQL
ncbi:hypothetical protein DLAC_07360 [Tieghemostelium lacteum]|uniref:Pectin lyase-like family protein n=1 Tax=Tieghemostelium lacteum TaxID=361077 RepID=A0A151ZCB5_TIELA|nr:hypothetical protein DLAC_07360 [Tieghemostelium lacteum]|eukprot:KYQ91593.1 hypothetical protein DLAC_07360 [Tieghemostelium lacteum]